MILESIIPSQANTRLSKELFSKLRFSYLEQVTKEKFLRAIVGDPPLIVGHTENVELEGQLAEVKAELKAQKEEARMMIEEMEKMSRDLASREWRTETKMSLVLTSKVLTDNLNVLQATRTSRFRKPNSPACRRRSRILSLQLQVFARSRLLVWIHRIQGPHKIYLFLRQ